MALGLTVMVYRAKVVKMHSVPTYIIVWLVCCSSIFSITIKSIYGEVSNFKAYKSWATSGFELMTYAAILFVLYHLYKINDNTINLAM